jgi:hypothetical protein
MPTQAPASQVDFLNHGSLAVFIPLERRNRFRNGSNNNIANQNRSAISWIGSVNSSAVLVAGNVPPQIMESNIRLSTERLYEGFDTGIICLYQQL